MRKAFDITVPKNFKSSRLDKFPDDTSVFTYGSGHQDAWVDYRNDDRAPLLFVSAENDNIMPPKVQRSNAKHYKSNTVTEVTEYPGFSHLLPAQEGWTRVADEVLEWALANSGDPAGASEDAQA